MTKTRNIADLLDANGDVKLSALDNVPASDNASALTTGTLPDGRFPATLPAVSGANLTGIITDVVGDTTPELGGNLSTNGNDINFGDNDKAVFGAGSDLQIWHSGGASNIKDAGTGNLHITADDLVFYSTGIETKARYLSNGAVELYYDNSKKFETTATGVDVTGTVAATALTGDGSGLTNVAGPSNLSSSFVTTTNSSGTCSSFITTTGVCSSMTRSYNNAGSFINFYASLGFVGSIYTNGDSYVAYGSNSDYRLKGNVTSNWDATTKLKQLNPVRFNFISKPDETISGFLAHEVQEVVPDAVVGAKDAVDSDGNPVYQNIDQSRLVPLLVKTVQELEARIAVLEAG